MSRDDPFRPRGRPRLYDWPPALDARLIALFEAGTFGKTIAGALDRPLGIVNARIVRLRELGRLSYRSKAWSAAETRRLLAALDAGAGYRELAPLFGRSRDALKSHANVARRARIEAEQAADGDQYRMELRAA